MSKFLILTGIRYGKPIFIGFDKVKTFTLTDSNTTFIEFLNGGENDYIYVKETPEEILNLIKEE
jgi:hypothetical protein